MTYYGGNRFLHVNAINVDPILVKLAGNEDRYTLSGEVEFRPHRELGALERLKTFPKTYNVQMVSPS